MELRHPGHVVSAQRGGQDLQEHPRADVEQGQEMGYGEAAAGSLDAGLAEVAPEFGCIGHGEARAIGDEDPMAVPSPGVVDRRPDPVGDAAEQLLEQGQRQAAPGLAVSRAGEGAAADADEMIDGRIAAEDLGEEQVNQGDGIEETAAPGVLDLAAGVDDLGSVELLGRSILEPAEDADEPMMHGALLSGYPDNPFTTGSVILFKSLPGQDLHQFLE